MRVFQQYVEVMMAAVEKTITSSGADDPAKGL